MEIGNLHSKCGGLGIIEHEAGTAEVCPECMGSGIIGMEVGLDECAPEARNG